MKQNSVKMEGIKIKSQSVANIVKAFYGDFFTVK